MRITDSENEYISRIDYRFDKNDYETREIFNTITEVLYKEFLDNPSFINLRMNLEKIVNDNIDDLKRENQIKLGVLKKRYNIDKGFNGYEHYMYDVNNSVNVNDNKIMNSIRKVVMAPLSEKYHKLVMYYLIYLYIKCKQNIMFEYVNTKIQKDLELEIESITKFDSIFSSFDNLSSYVFSLDEKDKEIVINYYNNGCSDFSRLNGKYKKYIDQFTNSIITDDFTDKGKVGYVDNSDSSIKVGLPSINVITYKKNNAPMIIK